MFFVLFTSNAYKCGKRHFVESFFPQEKHIKRRILSPRSHGVMHTRSWMGFKSGTKPYFKPKSSLLQIIHFYLVERKKKEKVKSPSFSRMVLRCKSCSFSAILGRITATSTKSFPFTIREKCDINHRGKSQATDLQLRAAGPRRDARHYVCVYLGYCKLRSV